MKKNMIIFFIVYIFFVCLPMITLKDTVFISSSSCERKEEINKEKTVSKPSKILKEVKAPTEEKNIELEQLKELENVINCAKILDGKEKLKDKVISEDVSDHIFKSDGYFKILNLETGQIDKVLEYDYVVGAVCAEMPPTFHKEALKAQAVSAHTYALKMKQEQMKNPDPKLKGAHFSADPIHWQKYVTKEIAKSRFGKQFDEYWGIFCDAVDEVKDVVMLYDDEPIIAAYHAISSGRTESAKNVWGGDDAPYLAPADSFGDNLAPNYKTESIVSLKKTKNILMSSYPSLKLSNNPEYWFFDILRSSSGLVLSVNIGETDIPGVKIRTLFNLRSANFTVDYDPENEEFKFTVKGYGHDIGLSQYGADYMAKNGSDFKKILNHYYTDIYFGRVSTLAS